MPTSSITKDFVVKDYDAYLRLLKEISNQDEKCKECDYSDICCMLKVPSDEACEAIKSCTKEFLSGKIYESLDEYVKSTNQND